MEITKPLNGEGLILGVTLARGGSKGVPGKNIADLGGKPVLWHTLHAGDNSIYLTDHVVCSDSEEILAVARDFGTICMVEPDELATDTSPLLPALQFVVKSFEQNLNVSVKYVIDLRATGPLKTAQDIDNCIQLLIETNADCVVGVTPCQEYHPSRVKYIAGGYLNDFMDEPKDGLRQNLYPKAYVRNGTIYAFKRSAIMGVNGRLFGHEKTVPYIMPPERSVNIDSELDLELARILIKRQKGVVK